MSTTNVTTLTIKATVNAPVKTVWKAWNDPIHITQWNQASEDWHSPRAENDLRVGGKIQVRMEAKDGSFGFDFEGTYTAVEEHKLIEYVLGDGRKVKIVFTDNGDTTDIVESFDAESENSLEMQQAGWQAILDSFKKYTEQL